MGEYSDFQTPGGKNFKGVKVQFAVGAGVKVGVDVEVLQAVPVMTAARRKKTIKGFSMTTVIYDLLLGKVNHQLER